MKLLTAVACLTFLFIASACGGQSGNAQNSASSPEPAESVPEVRLTGSDGAGVSQPTGTSDNTQATQQTAAQRTIIRDADITLEVASPAEGQRKLASVAEAHGGYAVTSESKLQDNASGGEQPSETVTVQLRVPASHFDSVLAEIRAIGSIRAEKQTGRDVTGVLIDLEKRLRTLRAEEEQFLKILASAGKVDDVREVRSQLDGVRREIERLESYQRFPGYHVAMSTINATLQPTAPPGGFFSGIKSAFGYGTDIALAIISTIVRLASAILPLLLIFVLPLVLFWRIRLHYRRP